MIAVNGKADPRRFKDWRQVEASLREEIYLGMYPEDSSIRVLRTNTRSTFWESFKWAAKFCYVSQ